LVPSAAELLAEIETRMLADARPALKDAEAVLAGLDRERDRPSVATALALVGKIHSLLHEHAAAVPALTEAAAMFRALGDLAGLAQAVLGLGSAAYRSGNAAEALDRFQETLSLAHRAGDKVMAIRALNNMASVHATFRDFGEAGRLLEQAVVEARAIDSRDDLVLPCCNLAQIRIFQVWESEPGTDVEADIAAAWAALEEAEANLADDNNGPYRLAVLAMRAQCENLRDDATAALATCDILLGEAAALKMPSMRASAHRERASAYLKLGRWDEAAAEAQNAVEAFQENNFVHETSFPLRHLALAEERRGNLAAALAAERRHHAVRHRVVKEAAERHANFVKARVALEKAEAEAAMHRRHAEVLETVNAELTVAKAAAEQARDAKGAFLSMMGHELRSPLQAILGFSEVISTRLYGDAAIGRYAAAAGDIHEAGRHLLKLINQILDYSKGEVGKLELEEDNVLLSGIVQAALRLVGDQAERKDVALVTAIEPDRLLYGDALKLTQCLLNMISNAVKFTPAGGEVAISTTLEPDWLVLQVRDTGTGLAPEDLPRVFEPFGQGRNASGQKGTGLGVPLTKMLMELHGGTLEIESWPGQGTCVLLRLPRDRLL
jgi:signal transduction histidine kinase